MATLALAKGNKADELRRIKEKSRKTQAFLSESKKVQSSSMKDTTSPERSMKAGATMMSQSSAGSGSVN
jgi:catabolite regulation protein CreA